MTTEPRRLCALADISDPGSKSFEDIGLPGLFAVRSKNRVQVYQNRCPHAGLPLNWAPDRFLDRSKKYIICSAHGAMFDIKSGLCVEGPCPGARLESVTHQLRDGAIWVAATATGR